MCPVICRALALCPFASGDTARPASEKLRHTSQEFNGWVSIVATRKRLTQCRCLLEPGGIPSCSGACRRRNHPLSHLERSPSRRCGVRLRLHPYPTIGDRNASGLALGIKRLSDKTSRSSIPRHSQINRAIRIHSHRRPRRGVAADPEYLLLRFLLITGEPAHGGIARGGNR